MARRTTRVAEMLKNNNSFDNRCRFNSGYHDAAQAVREGWATVERNFGFAAYGPLAGLKSPEDVLTRHFDRNYAHGWMAGYRDMTNGTYQNDSTAAWNTARKLGLVR